MRKNLLTLYFLLIVTVAAISQKPAAALQPATPESAGFSPERLKRIDNNFTEWMSDGRLNGSVALIVRNGKIVYHKAFGYDDLKKTVPMKTDMIFRIASQTKAITSVAVMILYEEGKFLLDDAVSKYIPEFAKPKVLNVFNEKDSSYTTVPAKREITIRDLLTHTSGIGYTQIGSKESNAIYANIPVGLGIEKGEILGDAMKKLGGLPLMHQPGEKFTYGLNTDVLGYLVEVVSGKNLADFFQQRIFEPLGMKDTYFYLPSAKHRRLVHLYQENDKKLVIPKELIKNTKFIVDYPLIEGTYYSGGAGLSSTALDYAIFLQALLNGGEYNGKRILARNTVRMMTMNQIGDINLDNNNNKFGLGFGITSERGSSILPVQEGAFEWGGAFATTYWVDPKEKLIGIIYRQLWGTTQWDIPNKYKVLVYQALND